jgi:hypothetical protein
MKSITDLLTFRKIWTLTKWGHIPEEATKMLQAGAPFETVIKTFALPHPVQITWEGNVGLNEGLALLLDLLIGAGGTVYSNANAYLGVGDSNAAESPSHTGLQASTNKLYKAMDGSYPQRSSQTVDWRATFGSSEANFAWEEYTVCNGNSDASTNLNRKITSKGTKASGESWTLSLQITAA